MKDFESANPANGLWLMHFPYRKQMAGIQPPSKRQSACKRWQHKLGPLPPSTETSCGFFNSGGNVSRNLSQMLLNKQAVSFLNCLPVTAIPTPTPITTIQPLSMSAYYVSGRIYSAWLWGWHLSSREKIEAQRG